MGSNTPSHAPPQSPTMPSPPLSANLPPTNGMARELSLGEKRKILHLGDPIRYNDDIYNRLSEDYEIIRPSPEQRERTEFIRHLKEGTWGNFSAIFRPFWSSGNEMKPWDPTLIELLPNEMEVMTSAGAGYDWVDTKCLAEHGIVYCNGAGASTEAVADMALFFIIGVFRQMLWSIRAAESNQPAQWKEAHERIPIASHNPSRHTLGIVGLGNIGLAIAKKAKAALHMKIIYHDNVPKSRNQEQELGATYYRQLKDLLPKCDCLLIATPHLGRALLDASTISLLPRGARVINIARGSLINEEALADALDSGHISAAALDVHADEHDHPEAPPVVNRRLSAMRNVLLTSHTGGGTVETIIGFENLAMENVELVLSGRQPRTPVSQPPIQKRKDRVNGNGHHEGPNTEHHAAKKLQTVKQNGDYLAS